ncbi:MAG: reprolysin-like metallopeptidase, partial [Chitinophagaceae bacterium]
QLRSYRLAVACTGEYARAATGNGASTTVAQALSAIVTSINRVDGVYEKELAISLNLVGNNNTIVFVDPATDPFTANDDGSALLEESQTVITNNIGAANYDMGHTFSTGAGGIAQLGTVCGSSKARGVTGLPNPVGDPYDIDYVAHEMGHQFDARHSFNSATGSCGDGNRNSSTAVEPGGGITIMSYAGICGSVNDLGQNSIPYFHGISKDEITEYVINGSGNTCGTISSTGNLIPVVNAGSDFTIPKSTPFVLAGSATDANGDALTYSWEEIDTGPAGDWNKPTGNAPLFRSFVPVSNPERYFPKISDQINNITTVGELLPFYGRTMKFRLTARDNRAGGGGVCHDESVITINSNSGPFVVTIPSATGITWSGSSTHAVTWDITNTNIAPVNCANVSIQLSTDGGLTFPVTILASTPNDGTQDIMVPNLVTNQARIRVKGVGNVFYDMSNNNFSITLSQAGFDFNIPVAAKVACANPASTSITLGTQSVLGYNEPITLSASGNPAGTTVTFSETTITPGSSVQVTLSNTELLPFDSTYIITVKGVSGSIVRTQELAFTIQTGASPAINQQPEAKQVCAGSPVTFSVVAGSSVKSYQWQFSNDNGQTFNNIAGATSPGYTISSAEVTQNNYLFRVLVRGQCNITVSNVVKLTVFSSPNADLSADVEEILPGESSFLIATITPGSGSSLTTTWLYNNDTIIIAGNTLSVPVNGLGTYQVLVSDNLGCRGESGIVTIRGKASSRLFIYPSPNDGRFTVGYYNLTSGNSKQSITVYDAKGSRIYFRQFTFTGTYGLHDIDLRGRPKGIYFIVLGDGNGKKITDGKVLINQ